LRSRIKIGTITNAILQINIGTPINQRFCNLNVILEAANQRDTKKVKEILQDTTYQVDEVDTEGNTPLNI
jgi:ABC-type microcin C transport system permease subunit YejB